MENMPWTEKYRPRLLSEISGNKDINNKFMTYRNLKSIPNLLIYGKYGTGKTTTILCLIHELYGDKYSKYTLKLNASDERGINVVRNKIQLFASSKSDMQKIVILEEFDNMLQGSQYSICVLMDEYPNTKFILSCNSNNNIIERIQSRCVILHFFRIDDISIRKYLLKIAECENIEYTDSGIDTLLFIADGDMRSAINNLQSTYYGHGKITKLTVYNIIDKPFPHVINDILQECLLNNIKNAIKKVYDIWNKGYSAEDIIVMIFRCYKKLEIVDTKKVQYIKLICSTHLKIIEGEQSLLQINGLISRLCMVN